MALDRHGHHLAHYNLEDYRLRSGQTGDTRRTESADEKGRWSCSTCQCLYRLIVIEIADNDFQQSLLAFPYAQWYENAPQASRPFIVIALLTWLGFLFSFIGISASDFFCPNLSSIASFLGLNESTAGVTFLAFGNGSPDVFSTFSALKGGTFGLAIGELIGAASFSEHGTRQSVNLADTLVSRFYRRGLHRLYPPVPRPSTRLPPRCSLLHCRRHPAHRGAARWTLDNLRIGQHGWPVHLLCGRCCPWQLVQSTEKKKRIQSAVQLDWSWSITVNSNSLPRSTSLSNAASDHPRARGTAS